MIPPTSQSKGLLSLSRFHRVVHKTVIFDTKALGRWRKWPLLRRLPYFTGDDVSINLYPQVLKNSDGHQFYAELQTGDGRLVSSLPPFDGSAPTTLTFPKIAPEGHFLVFLKEDLPIERAIGGSEWSDKAADIQVIADYKAVT